jgi:creatinine amidohydrolase
MTMHGSNAENEPLMLADLTWPEVRRHVEDNSVVLLPVGAFEQHGPGMTLETDTRLATELCRRISARLAPRVLVAPPVTWGRSDYHMGFAGTISLQPETFFLVIRDIIMSLIGHGFRRILLVNGHGGNMAAVEEACEVVRTDTVDASIEAVTYFALAPLPASAVAHAGEVETSCALALVPQLVRRDRLVPAEMLCSVPPSMAASSPPAFHEMTRTGNLGDPTLATRDVGEQLVGIVLDRLCEIVTSLSPEKRNVNSNGRKENTHGTHAGEPDHRPTAG